eukprot:COSAG03_NODE_3855_length_1792_cov_1.371311_4_plen_91_part_00
MTYNEYDTPQGVSYRREGYTGIVCTVDGGVVEVVLDCDGSVVKLARNTYCARLAVGDPTASLQCFGGPSCFKPTYALSRVSLVATADMAD